MLIQLDSKRIASGLLFFINLQILFLAPLLMYSLNPYPARLVLLIVFLSPLFWLYYYSRPEWSRYSESSIFRFLSFLGVSCFIYLLYNLQHFLPLFDGVLSSEVTMLAEEYIRQGSIVRSSTHSYFFQAPYIAYTLSQVCGLPAKYAVLIEQATIIMFLAFLSAYLFNMVRAKIPNHNGLFLLLSCVVPFAFIASGTRIWVPGLNVNYRDIGSYLTMFGFSYIVNKGLENRRDYVIMLLLILGSAFGSPPATILLILFFSVYSLITKQIGSTSYVILPLFYLVSSAGLYISNLRSYFQYTWAGIAFFLMEVLSGRLPEGLSPVARYAVPYGDRYVDTAAYLSVLGVAGVIILLRIASGFRQRQNRNRDPMYKTIFIVIFLTMLLTVGVTVGASVMPETSFSDIRTIVFSFLLLVLPFVFASQQIYRQIQQLRLGKVLLIMMLGLICGSSLIMPYGLFPKSRRDQIYILEDRRLSQSIGYAKTFLFDHYKEGTIYFDYKSNLHIVRFMLVNRTFVYQDVFYAVYPISNLETLEQGIAFFDKRGVTYPSLYITFEDYQKTYNLSMDANIVFDDGAFMISTRQRIF